MPKAPLKDLFLYIIANGLCVVNVKRSESESESESESKILPQYQISLIAHFVLRESCWGCHPKPALLRLAPLEKIPQKLFRIFSKTLPLLPLFFSH